MTKENQGLAKTPIEAVRTFQIKTIGNMLSKLDWEITQLRESQFSVSSSIDVSSYFAINAAVTAFHIVDWIWQLGTPEQQAGWVESDAPAKPNRQTRFQINLKKRCPELGVCREIANTFKHLTDNDYTDKRVLTNVPVFVVEIPALAGVARAGDPLVQYGKILMVRTDTGITYVAHVLTRAHCFLAEFCEANGLLPQAENSA